MNTQPLGSMISELQTDKTIKAFYHNSIDCLENGWQEGVTPIDICDHSQDPSSAKIELDPFKIHHRPKLNLTL